MYAGGEYVILSKHNGRIYEDVPLILYVLLHIYVTIYNI